MVETLFTARSTQEVLGVTPRTIPPARHEELKARIMTGGYPEPSLKNDAIVRRTWYESYRKTYLERDLRELAEVQSLPEFGRLLTLVALRTGNLLNAADLARDAGLSNTTARRYLGLLQQTFQIFLLQPWFANVGKRLVKTPKLYVTDTGLGCHLAAADDWNTLERQLRVGAIVETFVANELRKLLSLEPGRTHLWFWRVEHGDEVDFLLERGGEVVGVEVKWGIKISADDVSPLRGCQAALGKAFRFGVLLHSGTEAVALGERLLAMPFSAFLGRDAVSA
jgi:predicted AAA+ superfamily ATPase